MDININIINVIKNVYIVKIVSKGFIFIKVFVIVELLRLQLRIILP